MVRYQGALSNLGRILNIKQIEIRVAELERKHALTALEKVELFLLKKGEKTLPRSETQFLRNEDVSSLFGYFRRLSQDAHNAGYYLEAMTLDILLIKYLVQVQWMQITDAAEVFDGKSNLKQILSKARSAGFDEALAERLERFYDNCRENKARLFTGDIRYEEIWRVFKQDPELLNDLFEFLNPS